MATLQGRSFDAMRPENVKRMGRNGEGAWTEAYKREANGDVRTRGTFSMLIDPDGLARTQYGYTVYGLQELERAMPYGEGPSCILWGRGAYVTTRPELFAKAAKTFLQ